jgi:hypothetical protein
MPEATPPRNSGSESALDEDRACVVPIGHLALAASILITCVQAARIVLALDRSVPSSFTEELVGTSAMLGMWALFLPAFVATVVESIGQSVRRPWSITLLLIVLSGACIAWEEHLDSVETAARRATPVAHAIERYVDEHGSPPLSLEALVPRYLEQVPAQLTRSYGPLQYARTDDPRGWSLSFYGAESTFGFAAGLDYQPDRSADLYDDHFIRCGPWAGWCDD